MKKILYVTGLLVILFACDDDDANASKAAEVRNAAMTGTWKITYFFDTDKEETDNFNGYAFQFAPNGLLTAADGSASHTGTWSVTDDGSGDDSNNYDDIDFNIAFPGPPDFEELSEDWEIISITDSKIELRHVSGGGGGTDLLTFEKL